MTPCRCGQKNCLCRRAGILTWRWRNGQPGSSGWLPCVAQSQKRILELERELASQSEELVDLQANLLSILREKVGNEALFWGAW